MNAELYQQIHQLRQMTTIQRQVKYRELFGQALPSSALAAARDATERLEEAQRYAAKAK